MQLKKNQDMNLTPEKFRRKLVLSVQTDPTVLKKIEDAFAKMCHPVVTTYSKHSYQLMYHTKGNTFAEMFPYVVTSPEVPIFSKFIGFSDIPNELYALSKDKCFREKDNFLIDWISF